jgi:menaquinone-9 beta-reductase
MSDCDLAIVGAGPAGAAAAIGALRADPTLRVVLLDRSDFPRDKTCGDGIAPQVVDLLTGAGVFVTDGWTAVPRLRLHRGALGVDRELARSTWVIPRAVFDARLVEAAVAAGADLVRHRVRKVEPGAGVRLDDAYDARVVIGADGAQSVVRRSLRQPSGPMAIAVRGYAPTPPSRSAAQVIAFDHERQPAYAWSFDRGDGLSNVGYGVLLGGQHDGVTKPVLIERLESLLPGSTEGGELWRGHRLPLSSGPWRPQPGPVLLAGDAAGLVNPMTGEGIFYAVATGLDAGRAAAEAIAAGDPAGAGARYAEAVSGRLDAHLRHIRLAARLCRRGAVIDAGLRAASRDPRVFDDIVELGLADGRITRATASGLARALMGTALTRSRHHQHEEAAA